MKKIIGLIIFMLFVTLIWAGSEHLINKWNTTLQQEIDYVSKQARAASDSIASREESVKNLGRLEHLSYFGYKYGVTEYARNEDLRDIQNKIKLDSAYIQIYRDREAAYNKVVNSLERQKL